MTNRTDAPEDLNLNNIVARQFHRAAEAMDLPEGLLKQIRACNAIYFIQFPVKFGINVPAPDVGTRRAGDGLGSRTPTTRFILGASIIWPV